MLPVSIDHPHTQVVQFPSNSPPYVPNVVVMPEAQSLLVHASSLVANEAGFYSSQSPARMFCYNVLAASGWANTAFSEVVKLACDSAVLKQRMGQAHTPQAVLADAVREVLTLYTSMLVMSYPELAQTMDPTHVNGAASNHRIYIDLMAQVESLYAQAVSYHAPQARFGHGGHSGHPQQHNQMPGQHPSMRGGNPRATQAVSNPVASSAFRGRNTQATQASTAPPSRFSTLPKQAVEQPSQPSVVQHEPDANILQGEIENMDREQHSIVYHGKKYDIPTSPLRRKMEEAVEIHEAIADMKPEEDMQYVCEKQIAEASLDELIALVRAKHAGMADSNLSIYQGYGMVVTPIISIVDTSSCFAELEKAHTFSEIARVLMQHLENVTDKSQLRLSLHFVAQIDRVMTKVLNDFLTRCIEGSSLRVTSFIEDAGGIGKYLNEKYKGRYNTAYTEYQRRVTNELFKHTKASGDAVSEITDYLEDAYCDNLVLSYGITYITASSAELGYNVDGKAKRVTQGSTPKMYRLIQAIQKQQRHTTPVYQLIITSDDARYAMFPIAGEDGVYTLIEL